MSDPPTSDPPTARPLAGGETAGEPEDERLERVLAVTQEMCQAAAAGDWTRVAELVSRRDALLAQAFADPAALRLSAHAAQEIERLMAINARIVELAQQERTARGERIRKQSLRRRATAAYDETAGGRRR